MAPRASTVPQGGSALDRLGTAGKLIFALLLLGVGAAGYFVLFYADVDSAIAAENTKSGKLRQDLAKAEQSREAYQKDLDDKTKCSQLEAEQKKILPDDSETAAFLAALQQTATSAGVDLVNWSPLDEVPQEFYAKVPMKLMLRGKYHQVMRFFHGVGQLDRIINVENIQLKVRKTGVEATEVEVECMATAFRSGGQKAAAQAAGAANPGRAGGGH